MMFPSWMPFLANFFLILLYFSMEEIAMDDQPSFGLNITQENAAVEDFLLPEVDALVQNMSSQLHLFQNEFDSIDNGEDDVAEDKDEFLPLDEEIMRIINAGGEDHSPRLTEWARRRFDTWRRHFKHDTSVPIEDLDLRVLNNLLVPFIIQVKKKNGHLYPPGSLSVLFRAIGRIVRKKQEQRVGETGIAEPKFNILQSDVFSKSVQAFVSAVKRSRSLGIGQKPKKAAAITFAEEKDLLSDIDHSIYHGYGCQKRLAYYLVTRFAIRGCVELHEVLDIDISLGSDVNGEFIRYDERLSKTNQVTATRLAPSKFRPSIWSYELDFIKTYKQYVRHLPVKPENSDSRALFLTPIVRPRSVIWYYTSRVSEKTIRLWLKAMGELANLDISNKSGRVTNITRMSLAGVPPEIGMKVSGHRTLDAYQEYDRSKDLQISAAMDILGNPENDDGTSKNYAQVISNELNKRRKLETVKGKANILSDDKENEDAEMIDNHVSTTSVSNSRRVLAELDGNIGGSSALDGSLAGNNAMVQKFAGDVSFYKDKNDREVKLDDPIDEAVLEHAIASWPDAAKALSATVIKNNSVTNHGGFTFVAPVTQCLFISCPDAQGVGEVLEKWKKM